MVATMVVSKALQMAATLAGLWAAQMVPRLVEPTVDLKVVGWDDHSVGKSVEKLDYNSVLRSVGTMAL